MTLQLNQPRLASHFKNSAPPDCRPFDVLEEYSKDRLSLDQTVERLAKPVEDYYDREQHEIAYRLLGFTWRTFASVVEQIPHGHDAHGKLAKLLVGIRLRDSPEGDDARSFNHDGQLWRDLPLYEPTARGSWSSPTDEITSLTARPVDLNHDTLGQLGGPDALREQYLRTNAFLARLVHLPGAPDYEIYALLALRWALEDDLNAQGLSLNVPGAAMWILYAGERIWKSEREWVGPMIDPLALYMSRGSLMWNESKKNGFCLERWALWRDSFGWVAEMEDVYDETRELATLAVERMRLIEENVPRD